MRVEDIGGFCCIIKQRCIVADRKQLPSYLWDYDISEQEFHEILAGERVLVEGGSV